LDYLKNIIKGVVIGISMMVPGVSGGTMAIVLGIYDKLVHSVAAIFKDFRKNILFLVQFGIGGAAGVLIFSRLMEGAMTRYPHIMRYLIMGVIIGGLPLLFKRAAESGAGTQVNIVTDIESSADAQVNIVTDIESGAGTQVNIVTDIESSAGTQVNIVTDIESGAGTQVNIVTDIESSADAQQNARISKTRGQQNGAVVRRTTGSASDYIFLVLGVAIVLLMSLEPGSLINMATDRSLTSYIFLLIAGVIIAVGVVLPGISWSFMLLVLGMYEITLNAINTFNIPFLIPLGIGMILGIFGTAKAIEKFLQKYPRKTYMLIIGFVAGSLVEVYPGIPQGWQLPVSAAAFIAGFAAIFILGKKGFAE
jgi:uncharacterized membrane protein